MFSFECFAKYGNRWSYKGTIQARHSYHAARQMQYIHSRHVWRIRPEWSNGGFYIYRIRSTPRVTS